MSKFMRKCCVSQEEETSMGSSSIELRIRMIHGERQLTIIIDFRVSWSELTFKKNKPPAGSIMRCEPASVFSSRPSLNHWIVGVGLPSALQLNVYGSFFGTVVSIGCSMMCGFSPGEWKAKEKKIISDINFNFKIEP